jgi:hypothetical protein
VRGCFFYPSLSTECLPCAVRLHKQTTVLSHTSRLETRHSTRRLHTRHSTRGGHRVPCAYAVIALHGIQAFVQGRDAGMGHDTPPPPPAVLMRRGLSLGPAVSVEREQRDWETRKREREAGLVRDAGIILPPCRRRRAAAAVPPPPQQQQHSGAGRGLVWRRWTAFLCCSPSAFFQKGASFAQPTQG